jgi:DNA-binding NarL/FixJ family response regulator
LRPVKVAIVEEHHGLRDRIARTLDTRGDIALRGKASNATEAKGVVERLRPHILLLSTTLPELTGIEAIPFFRHETLPTKIIMLMPSSNDELAAEVIRAGARGYILKSTRLSALVKAIKVVHAGEIWAEHHVVARLLDELFNLLGSPKDKTASLTHDLTEKELRVARLVASGLQNREVAHKLSVGEKAVKASLTKIFRKLGVKSRVQLALLFWRKKFLGQGLMSKPKNSPVPAGSEQVLN